MANHVSHAALPYPIKNARFTLAVPYLASTGVPTDPTTPDTEVSIDGAAFADCAEEVTTISGSNGFGWITLSGAETNGSLIVLAAKVASGPNTTLASLTPRVLAAVGSGTLSAGSAGGGTLGTLLAYDVTGCFIRSTGGTGGGGTGGANNQAKKMVTYNVTTGAFTVSPNWETTPSTDTTYDVLLPEGVTLGMLRALNPTTPGRTLVVDLNGLADANVVKVGPTGTGTPQTARDLGLALPAAAPNANGGLPILSVSGTTLGYTVTTLTTYTGDTPQTGDAYAVVASGTFGNAVIKGYVDDIGVAGAGLTALGDTRIAHLNADIDSRMASYTQPTGFLAATFPGTVASTTNITAANVTTTDISAAALAKFFTLDTTKLYADAITGSVVKETAANAGGVPVDGSLLVTLADGVAHGGPLQTSTATLAMARVVVQSAGSDPTFVIQNDGAGLGLLLASNFGIGCECLGEDGGLSITGTGEFGVGMTVYGTVTGVTVTSTSGPAVNLFVNTEGDGIAITSAGVSKHDIVLLGSGGIWNSVAGRPVDVRLADATDHGGTPGSSTATLALDNVRVSAATGNAVGITSADAHAVAITAALDGVNVTASRYGIALNTTDISLYLNSGVNGVKIDSTGAAISSGSAFDLPLSAAALASFFATNSGTTYASAVAGSVVKEIASNAGTVVPVDGSLLVTLADGVAHGGAPGSSTATLALQQVKVQTGSGDTVSLVNTSNGSVLKLENLAGGFGLDVRTTSVAVNVRSDEDVGVQISAPAGRGIAIEARDQALYATSAESDALYATAIVGYGLALSGGGGPLAPSTLAAFFTVDSGVTYGEAVDRSVVKEIAANAGVADTPGTTTLLSRIGSAVTISGGKVAATLGATDYSGNTVQTGDAFARLGVAGAGLTALGDARLAHLDADVSSAGGLNAVGVRAAIGMVAADLDTQLGAILASASSDIPTPAEIADGILARNLAGGSDGGRTVQDALRFLRNRWERTDTTLTIYAEDDTTIAWSSIIVSSASAIPVTSSDPT